MSKIIALMGFIFGDACPMTHWIRPSIPRGFLTTTTVSLVICFLVSGCQIAEVTQPSKAGLPSSESANCASGDRVDHIASGGVQREYRIHVPTSLPDDTPSALVFGFHVNGGSAGGFADYTGFLPVSDREGFIMVYPQGMGEFPTWEIDPVRNNPDVQFVRDLIAELESRCKIDPSRVYATGHSRGGGMANRLACDLSDQITAIGPVSGTYPLEDGCRIARPVSVIAFHGDADPDVPYNGIKNQSGPPEAYFAFGIPIIQWASAWAARDGCAPGATTILDEKYLTGLAWSGCRGGGDVVFYTIPGGGHGWPGGSESAAGGFDTARMIWDFFEAHPRGSG
ncbi:MAG: PHB depolymerase family esterase [Anaerolineales bacterium]